MGIKDYTLEQEIFIYGFYFFFALIPMALFRPTLVFIGPFFIGFISFIIIYSEMDTDEAPSVWCWLVKHCI